MSDVGGLWTVLGLAGAECPYLVVQPNEDEAVLSRLVLHGIEHGVARGSLVRVEPAMNCDDVWGYVY